jgi:RNA polymerase sigma-70 factor, ECF subfamily
MEIVLTPLNTPEYTEDDLLRRARRGEPAAFGILYRARSAAIFRYALHMTGNASIAEEVLQETFLSVLRDASGYDPARGSLGSYLFGIARNRLRRQLASSREFSEPDTESPADTDLLEDLTRRETIETVRKAVLGLPHTYREAVVLCELQEMSYDEAAILLAIPIGTVRSRLHRGRALLIERLTILRKNKVLV